VIQDKISIRLNTFIWREELFDDRIKMTDRTPEITVDTHDPTGAAQVSVSVWLTEKEQEGLLDRLFSQQTLLHEREEVLRALQLVDDSAAETVTRSNRTAEQQVAEKAEWELSLVEFPSHQQMPKIPNLRGFPERPRSSPSES
jgi:hypothetical protein